MYSLLTGLEAGESGELMLPPPASRISGFFKVTKIAESMPVNDSKIKEQDDREDFERRTGVKIYEVV